ncbi:hypothetical protein ABTZ57_06400 [Streptomyces sp. NPDC094048]|uniref:hypothetical protein n=1 Tax=unclassified Streptomyces TaxID=2593676 RepID=UPI0033322A17
MAGDGEQGALGKAVVERGRGGRAGVSRARHLGAGGDSGLDGVQGASDVGQPVRLGVADAELRVSPPEDRTLALAGSCTDPNCRTPH